MFKLYSLNYQTKKIKTEPTHEKNEHLIPPKTIDIAGLIVKSKVYSLTILFFYKKTDKLINL